MDSEELLSKNSNLSFGSYPPFRSLCEDPWYFFLPSTGGHRLKCCLNVTLERKGKEDVSCSYVWQSKQIDWFLASNIDQIQLNEVAFRLKLSTWRHRNPFLRPRQELPEFDYHWVRPGAERSESESDSNEKYGKKQLKSLMNFLPNKINPNSLTCFLFFLFIILTLMYFIFK